MSPPNLHQPKPQNLAGKIAIVTGGSRSIGAGIAFELAQRGAKVNLSFLVES
jgi:3-oxoacyl-[acyl-carrier protein] reductase